jgi:hypothetical protein
MASRKIYILILIALTSNICFVFAQNESEESKTGKYANAYLDIGVSARAIGLSNTMTSTVNDVSSGFWNPSGLANMKNGVELALMHNEHFGGIVKYDYGAVAARLNNKSGLGFSIIRSGVDNIPNTLELIDKDGNIQYDRITSFSVADYAFMFSYARKSPVEGLNYGATAKVLYRNIGKFGNGWGIGFDIGAQYIRDNLRIGLMLRDISTTITNFTYNTEYFAETFQLTGNRILAKSTEIALPRIILGASYRTYFTTNKFFHFTPSLDFVITTDGKRNTLISSAPLSISPALGLEFGFKDIVYLRGGIGKFQRTQETADKTVWIFQPNIGLGFRVNLVHIDYALANLGNQSNGLFSHVFSLKLTFNRQTENYINLENRVIKRRKNR